MPAEFNITLPRATLERLLERNGRRVMAQRVRRAGEACYKNAVAAANSELAIRAPSRRRTKGPHYQNAFRQVQYRGLSDFASGVPLTFEISNTHQFARLIEHGSGGHTIKPRKGGALRWPAHDYSQPGPPWKTLKKGQKVSHPGTPAYNIMENAVRDALRAYFGSSGRRG